MILPFLQGEKFMASIIRMQYPRATSVLIATEAINLTLNSIIMPSDSWWNTGARLTNFVTLSALLCSETIVPFKHPNASIAYIGAITLNTLFNSYDSCFVINAIALGTLAQLEVPGGIPNLFRHVKGYTEAVMHDALDRAAVKIDQFTYPLRLVYVND